MIDVFSALSSGIQQTFKAGRALAELKVDTEVAGRINAMMAQLGDLTGKFLAAQAAHIETQQRADAAEEEIARLKCFAAERERYALNEIAPGAFCYTLRADRQDQEPIHHLCAACYSEQTKSILQFSGFESGRRKCSCPRCKAFILVNATDAGCVEIFTVRKERSMFGSGGGGDFY